MYQTYIRRLKIKALEWFRSCSWTLRKHLKFWSFPNNSVSVKSQSPSTELTKNDLSKEKWCHQRARLYVNWINAELLKIIITKNCNYNFIILRWFIDINTYLSQINVCSYHTMKNALLTSYCCCILSSKFCFVWSVSALDHENGVVIISFFLTPSAVSCMAEALNPPSPPPPW